MIRIDSDTHFTPLDALADLDPKYADQGPRVVVLPTGRYRIDYAARAPFVPAHIKPLRVNGRPKSGFEIAPRLEAMAQDGFDIQVLIPNMLQAREGLTKQDIDNLLGGTAAEFFGLKQYL